MSAIASLTGLALPGSAALGQTAADIEDLPLVQPAVRKPAGGGAWSAEVKQRTATSKRASATAIRISGDPVRTVVKIEVTRPIVASMFTLGQPYRAIIDVPDLDFQLPAGAGSRATGIVSAFRYGQFEAGRSRIVIDLAGPATIEKASFLAPSGKEPGVLSFELLRVGAAAFKNMRGATDPDATPDLPPDARWPPRGSRTRRPAGRGPQGQARDRDRPRPRRYRSRHGRRRRPHREIRDAVGRPPGPQPSCSRAVATTFT